MTWVIFAIMAAVLTTGSALMQKKTLNKQHANEFASVLAIVNLVLSAPLFLLIDYSRIVPESLIYLFFLAILGASAFLLVAKSLRHMELSACSPLLVIGPATTAIIAYFFLGEALSSIQIGGMMLLIVGTYILELQPKQSLLSPFIAIRKSKYIHYIFIALLLYSISSVGDKFILNRYSMQPIAYLAFAHLFIAFHLFVILSIRYDGPRTVARGLKSSWKLIAITSVFTIGYRLSQLVAIQTAKVALVISIKRSSALLTTFLGGELFHESNLAQKMVAAVIMVVGCLMIIIESI